MQQSISSSLARPPDATRKTILKMLNCAETAEAERDEYYARRSNI